jgi:hypothetical protein
MIEKGRLGCDGEAARRDADGFKADVTGVDLAGPAEMTGTR